MYCDTMRGKEPNEEHKVKTPFQNVVMEEEQIEDEDEIHCMEDKGSVAFLTLSEYEDSLLQEHRICLFGQHTAGNPIFKRSSNIIFLG